jgi:hypothetical protein
MKDALKILALTLPLITNLTKVNDEREQRRNIRTIKTNRRKLYKIFKKDGFTDDERQKLAQVDSAWVSALIELGKF